MLSSRMLKGCFSIAVTVMLHTAVHLMVYATSVVESPTKIKQVIVPPTPDVIGGPLWLLPKNLLWVTVAQQAIHLQFIDLVPGIDSSIMLNL